MNDGSRSDNANGKKKEKKEAAEISLSELRQYAQMFRRPDKQRMVDEILKLKEYIKITQAEIDS